MPPSPALRGSPKREMRADKHRRGLSFESGMLPKEKDDDLALFNEVQTREKDNFLLQSSDDIEDAFSTKLKYFSDYKLGINIPARAENNDLLNVDGEKNDYDWLLTPPDTPLFPSLDDELTPVSIAPRGRPRSQPISISRSSTMEKSYRSNRGSPSPNRLSPSPKSGNSSFQLRGRPSSAPNSSPTPTQRNASPSRRPSPPPSKPLTPSRRSTTPTPRRSSTPTPRRMSTGSSGARGVSPVKTTRGNSASPKVKAWQSNFPGFSSEAPPNLRTSLEDRPVSYVRGSSPASRSSRDSTSKYSRQSMSPTPSRSASSSHSHDRDRFSARSKGSIASSGDDDLESLYSTNVGSLDRYSSRKGGVFTNARSPMLSKKPARILSPSSAPKRPFDSALRQMGHRKSPPNMFRPLLSSVPSTTFYVGKTSSAHHSLISRDSSVTTSTNAGSDQGLRSALDTERSEHIQDDLGSECGKLQRHDVNGEVYPFETVHAITDAGQQYHDGSVHGDIEGGLTVESCAGDSQDLNDHENVREINSTSEDYHVKGDKSEVYYSDNMGICSQCGCKYPVINPAEKEIMLCPECERTSEHITVSLLETTVVSESSIASMNTLEEHRPLKELGPEVVVPEFPSATDTCELSVSQEEENIVKVRGKQCHDFSQADLLNSMRVERCEHGTANQQGMGQSSVDYCLPEREAEDRGLQHDKHQSDSKIDAPRSAGISVLLSRSSSSKGPVIQGRSFTATTISCDNPSYARESTSSLRTSIGHSSTSVSSSFDFTLVKQTEGRMQRQLSRRKSDLESHKSDMNTKRHRSVSSFSEISNHSHSVGLQTGGQEEHGDVTFESMDFGVVEERRPTPQDREPLSEGSEVDNADKPITESAISEEDHYESNDSSRTMDATSSEVLYHTYGTRVEETSVASVHSYEDSVAHENGRDFSENAKDVEASPRVPESCIGEEHIVVHTLNGVHVVEVPNDSLFTASEIQCEDLSQSTSGSQIDDDSGNSKSIVDKCQENRTQVLSDKEISSVSEPNNTNPAHDVSEESTVLLEGRRGSKSRSLTLEEATDTILFCSSIVHDLAYEAVTIAMEKESSEPMVGEPLEGSRPTVTVVDKPSSDRIGKHGRSVVKRGLKSQKGRQRRVETNSKLNAVKAENDENAGESLTQIVGLPDKVDSTKPPKLESKCNCTIM